MYPQLASAADKVDMAFLVIFGVSIVILLGITAAGLYFVWRYHHSRHPEPAQIHGNVWAELAWTIIPTALVMVLFYYGWTSYQALRSVPADAMEVKVTARMWSWIFEYENGKRSDVLVVPEGQAVKLNMTSLDVIHSFYVPAFRIKMDTVPGMQTYTWFRHDEPGEFDILCAEYCGLKHANMLSVVRIVSREEYDQWLAGEATDVETGPDPMALLELHGCLGCHSMDGSDSIGPTLAGIYGRETVLTDGTTLVIDEAYLRRAILEPEAEIPQGYEPVMPGYEGMIPDEELEVMLTYLVRGEAEPESPGRVLAEGEGCLSCHSTDGTIIAGPTFRDMFMSTVTDSDGNEHLADREFLAQGIVSPDMVLYARHDPIMPPYDYLSQEEVTHLVDYIVSLSDADGQPADAPEAPVEDEAAPDGQVLLDGTVLMEDEGCLACHSIDGSDSMGPSFKGLYMSLVEGRSVDDEYLRQAIIDPSAFIREGQDDSMPAYDTLDEAHLQAMIEYIKTLGQAPADPGEATDSEDQTPIETEWDGASLMDAEGCLACHSIDGSDSMGPSFKNLYLRLVPTMDDGGPEIIADEDYLMDSIVNPGYQLREGYDDVMPAYDYLDQAQVQAMVEYIKTLAEPLPAEDAAPLPDGMEVADSEGCLSCHSLDGSRRPGPTLKGLYMSRVATDKGPDVLVDEEYLYQAIVAPEVEIREGYGSFMPAYDYLDDAHVEALIVLIKSLAE